jgi:hypothetical protein
LSSGGQLTECSGITQQQGNSTQRRRYIISTTLVEDLATVRFLSSLKTFWALVGMLLLVLQRRFAISLKSFRSSLFGQDIGHWFHSYHWIDIQQGANFAPLPRW